MKEFYLRIQLICAPNTKQKEIDNMAIELIQHMLQISFIKRADVIDGDYLKKAYADFDKERESREQDLFESAAAGRAE